MGWQKNSRRMSCPRLLATCFFFQPLVPISFKNLLTKLASHQAAIVPWEDARGYSLAKFHAEHPDITDLAIVIGPEGGMSEDEIARMKNANCLSVTLGPRILRTETAGLCAMSALLCLYGDME